MSGVRIFSRTFLINGRKLCRCKVFGYFFVKTQSLTTGKIISTIYVTGSCKSRWLKCLANSMARELFVRDDSQPDQSRSSLVSRRLQDWLVLFCVALFLQFLFWLFLLPQFLDELKRSSKEVVWLVAFVLLL